MGVVAYGYAVNKLKILVIRPIVIHNVVGQIHQVVHLIGEDSFIKPKLIGNRCEME